jgi:hypothetical protein
MRAHNEQFAQVPIARLRNAPELLLAARPSDEIVVTATPDAVASDWNINPAIQRDGAVALNTEASGARLVGSP